jgi:hypothetical protein
VSFSARGRHPSGELNRLVGVVLTGQDGFPLGYTASRYKGSMKMSVSWFGAWHLWFSGKPLTGLKLWGIDIIWWGRIGKILEFVAAYGVIVEIAGPERLRRYGESLRHLVPKSAIGNVFHSTRIWTRATIRFFFSWPGSAAEKRALEESHMSNSMFLLHSLSSLVLAVTSALVVVHLRHWKWEGFSTVVSFVEILIMLFGLWLFVITPALAYLFLGLIRLIGYTTDAVFFRSAASVLEYKKLDATIKVLALIVLAIGFQFDLLLS